MSISPLAHLEKYGTDLDGATLGHLYQKATERQQQLLNLRGEMTQADFDEHFAKDLAGEEKALALIDAHRAGTPTLPAEAPAEPQAAAEAPRTPYLLEHLRRKAYEAYSNLSHVPNKRAETVVSEYSAELAADLAQLAEGGVDAEGLATYQAGYEEHLRACLAAKARCMSSMITGPANFPVASNQKKMNSERKRYEEFEEWRRKALKRALNGPRVPVTPLTELEQAQANLTARESAHEQMLAFNKLLRKAKGRTAEDLTRVATEAGLTPELVTELLSYRKHSHSDGFPSFHLTNNKVAINRLRDRVMMLEAKVEVLDVEAKVVATFEGGKVVEDYGMDRIQIFYDAKPGPDVIRELKSNGFKWAPSVPAWQRKLTHYAQQAAKQITKTWGAPVPA